MFVQDNKHGILEQAASPRDEHKTHIWARSKLRIILDKLANVQATKIWTHVQSLPESTFMSVLAPKEDFSRLSVPTVTRTVTDPLCVNFNALPTAATSLNPNTDLISNSEPNPTLFAELSVKQEGANSVILSCKCLAYHTLWKHWEPQDAFLKSEFCKNVHFGVGKCHAICVKGWRY